MPRVKIDGDWYPLAVEKGIPAWRPSAIQVFPPQVSQEDMAEAQLPADKRPAVTVRDVSDGYGQDEQPLDGPIRRFDRIGDASGEGVDCSLTPDGPILLAPALWTPVSGGSPSQNYVRALQWSVDRARVFYGTNIYTFTNWTASDIGNLASDILGQPVAFRGTQPTEHWYVPYGAGVTPGYSTDQGATWTSVSTGGGFTEALDLTVVDGEVIFLYTGQYGTALRRFQDGGINPTVYGTIDPVTTQASVARRIVNWNDRAVIISAQEVIVLARDKSELTQNLLPEVTFGGDTIFVDGVYVWRGILLIPTSRGLAALSSGGGVQWIGPDEDNGGIGFKGIIKAVSGDAYNLYGFFSAPGFVTATFPAWLFKANVTVSGGSVSEIAWFPILNLGVVNQCYGMTIIRHRVADFGGQPTKSLLLSVEQIGAVGSFLNENLHLIRLPNFGRDPRADTNYRYALNGTFYPSRLNARFMAFSKDWLSVLPRNGDLGYGVDQLTATTGLGLQVRYKADTVPLIAAGPYGYSTATTQGATEATGVRVDLSGVRARGLDLAVRFSTSHAFSNQSPQLYAVTTDYRTAPDSIWQHEIVLDISSGAYEDDGSGGYGDPMPPDVAYRKLRTLPNKAPFEFIDPMGNVATAFVQTGGIHFNPQGFEEGYAGATPTPIALKIPLVIVETVPASAEER